MGKKGRPISENPRTDGYRLRMTRDERKLLDATCAITGMNKADTIRFALERLYSAQKQHIRKLTESKED